MSDNSSQEDFLGDSPKAKKKKIPAGLRRSTSATFSFDESEFSLENSSRVANNASKQKVPKGKESTRVVLDKSLENSELDKGLKQLGESPEFR